MSKMVEATCGFFLVIVLFATIIVIKAQVSLVVLMPVFGLGCPGAGSSSVVLPWTLQAAFTSPAGQNAPESRLIADSPCTYMSCSIFLFFFLTDRSRFLWPVLCWLRGFGMSKGGGVLEVELEAVRLSLLIPLSSICACLHRSRTISAPHDLGAFPDFPPPFGDAA